MGTKRDIEKDITAMITNKAAEITSGGCKSFEDYRARCGELVGLYAALRKVRQVFEHYNMFGDDD